MLNILNEPSALQQSQFIEYIGNKELQVDE